MLPMQPGRPERRTHGYVRHGTTTLFAALEVATGQARVAITRLVWGHASLPAQSGSGRNQAARHALFDLGGNAFAEPVVHSIVEWARERTTVLAQDRVPSVKEVSRLGWNWLRFHSRIGLKEVTRLSRPDDPQGVPDDSLSPSSRAGARREGRGCAWPEVARNLGWPDWSPGHAFPGRALLRLGPGLQAGARNGRISDAWWSDAALVANLQGVGFDPTTLVRLIDRVPIAVLCVADVDRSLTIDMLERAGITPTFVGRAPLTNRGHCQRSCPRSPRRRPTACCTVGLPYPCGADCLQ